MDIIKIDKYAFLRLVELARSDIKNDAELQELVESLTEVSRTRVVTIESYHDIVRSVKAHGVVDELAQIRKLGGF